MKPLSAVTWQKIRSRDDNWVKNAQELANQLKDQGKERQFRNIQSMAESSASWEAVALFIRYQAARGQIDKQWAGIAVNKLSALKTDAQAIAGKDSPDDVHMQLVIRVLGYAVRWYVWNTKGQEEKSK